MRNCWPIALVALAAQAAAPHLSFNAPKAFAVPEGAYGQLAADYNGDGKLDLAVSGYGVVSILLGNGDGTFQPAVTYPLPGQGVGILTADFNGDGKLDLAVSYCPLDTNCITGGGVAVLLGNGDGSFQPAITTVVGKTFPTSIAVADFNGDSKPDLAGTLLHGPAWVMLGNGDGTFQSPRTIYAAKEYLESATVADFNGDGKPDLAVSQIPTYGSSAPAGITILLGNGDGTFHQPVTTVLPFPSGVFVVADFNGDGKPDLAAGEWENEKSDQSAGVAILLGKGDGTFTAGARYNTGQDPYLAVGDFNADGKLDLVLGTTNVISILPGNGDGTFGAAPKLPESGTPYNLTVGDFDGDGTPDLAVGGIDSVAILLNGGKGGLQHLSVGQTDIAAMAFAVADFNGDGKLDVASVGSTTVTGREGGLQISLGNGNGTFTALAIAPVDYEVWNTAIGSIASGDFDGDGKPDLVVVPSLYDARGVYVLLGNGDGTFSDPVNYALPAQGGTVTVADLNGDGHLDLVVTPLIVKDAAPVNTVYVLLGKGDGTFHPATQVVTGDSPTSLAVADFNGDGIADLAVLVVPKNYAGAVAILLGNGDGTFQTPVLHAAGQAPVFVATADLNGDGKADLVVTNNSPATTYNGYIGENSIAVLLGNGDGTFKGPALYPAGTGPALTAVIADFNGDGKPDVAVAGDMLTVLLGKGGGAFEAPKGYDLQENTALAAGLAVGDFNGDGKPDLLEGGFGNVFSILLNTSW
jgi:hypothetical protein